MRALEFEADVDVNHRVQFSLPSTTPPGPVRVLVLLPESSDEDVDSAWQSGIAREWADELGDVSQDIYTLKDGEPIRDSR